MKALELCDAVPLDLNDQDVNQKHHQALGKARLHVASQWARLLQKAIDCGYDREVMEEKLRLMGYSLNKIMKEYAQVIPFAPDPEVNLDQQTDLVKSDENLTPKSSTTSVASPLTGSSLDKNSVPFEMKFLQVGHDVWTVLQVSLCSKIGQSFHVLLQFL